MVLKSDASPAIFNQHISSEFAGQNYKYNTGLFKGYAWEFNDLTVARIKERSEVLSQRAMLIFFFQVVFTAQDGVVTVGDCASQRLNLVHLKENEAWEEFPTNQLVLGVNTSIPRVNWDVLRLYSRTSSIVVFGRDTRDSKAVLRIYGRQAELSKWR